MEGVVTENVCSSSPVLVESQNVKTSESAENFQKFMYDLLENKGVINDLRAYLRGHIVGVLRSARTGDPPACQKHFTQRMELPFQALNMILVEYLLRMEFTYSLSVFVSEIPLANMVFAFAKSLMQGNDGTELRFNDEDVWSILNFLGIKCDSEHASNLVEMYKNEKHLPLLLCIFKCMPMYKEPVEIDDHLSDGSLPSTIKSSGTLNDNAKSRQTASTQEKCKHSAFCKTCQTKILRIKEKYEKKKKNLIKNIKETNERPLNVESVMKNIDNTERSLIDEMFQELKSVYEAEIEMIKSEEERRVKRSLATLAVHLQKKRAEMEEKFKAREVELESNVQQKKRFLWGLARLLREQHTQMSRAMHDIRTETTRLSAKEDSFKSQLAEAGQILRQRGEDMRHQISSELVILEGHLESMKKERETINKERSELEHIKHLCESGGKTTNIETKKEDLCSHYDLLKDEFVILNKYLETTKLEPKCVIERSTMTESADGTGRNDVLNNEQDVETCPSEDKVKAKRVVNDLKKLKNVNFSPSNLEEIYRDRSRSSHSRSPGSSEAGAASLHTLREENERLRDFARQQREHIDELSSQQARLQAELTAARLPSVAAAAAFRPRTAPAAIPNGALFMQQLNPNGSSNNLCHGWRKGAGEELSYLANAPPRIVVPGDTLPFIGLVRERHNDNRRYLINQWRSLRGRVSSVGGVGKCRASARDTTRERANSARPNIRFPPEDDINNDENATPVDLPSCTAREEEHPSKVAESSTKSREKSPKSVLREAKQKLKPNDNVTRPPLERGQSPNTVLRDAKRRLRKLEIEAEAVEMSYLNFRRKQEAMRDERRNTAKNGNDTAAAKEIDLNSFRIPPSPSKADETITNESTSHKNPLQTPAHGKYIQEYQAKTISDTHFKNKNATLMRTTPIPPAFNYDTVKNKENKNQSYLETPMAEFRKYYQSEKRVVNGAVLEDRPSTSVTKNVDNFESNRPNSPVFINSGSFNFKTLLKSPRKTIISEERSSLRSPLPLNVGTVEERVDFKSPVTNNEGNTESNSCLKVPAPVSQGRLSVTNSPIAPTVNIEESYSGNDEGAKTETAKEVEIQKQDFSKIYDCSSENDASFKTIENSKEKIENESKALIDGTIIESSKDEAGNDSENKNLLRIELQSAGLVNDVKVTESETQDLLLVFESPIVHADEHSDINFQKDVTQSTQMTILVSPKKSSTTNPGETKGVRSPAKNRDFGEKSMLSGHDGLNSIYEADPNKNLSSVQMQVELSKETLMHTTSELGANEPDYADDFSADVDNFNSRYDTDFDNQSPISMPKTSEDDNFWDS